MKLLEYRLIPTTRRLTFDIIWQSPNTIFRGEDDGDYFKFTASNGYEVISRSRMDIQTERLWLLGAKYQEESRSGSMVFSSDTKRDVAMAAFRIAIDEWAANLGGFAVDVGIPKPITEFKLPDWRRVRKKHVFPNIPPLWELSTEDGCQIRFLNEFECQFIDTAIEAQLNNHIMHSVVKSKP